MIKELNTQLTKLDDRISELFSQLESKRHQTPISQYSEAVISDIRELQDISERLQLVKRRIGRFTRQLERYEESSREQFQINPETD